MLGVGLPAVDLSALLQLVLTALALLFGALLLVKNAASRYFVVDDATFEPGEDYEARHRMSIGGAGDGEATAGGPVPGFCVVCQRPATKKCSRCKSVRYCSQACQTKHWENHKLKCKQARLSDKLDTISPNNDACRRRKPSGFSSISLVPARGTCKVLQEPKKILFPYDEFLMLFNWDKPGFPPCGLLNCGNSCFANVVLQCLACTRPLLAFLLEKDHSRKCIRKQNDWCFLCELQVHIRRASESLHPFSPINILSRLPNIGGNLGYGRQEDAHEFMRFAIDTMQSVCLDEFGGENALDPSTQETTLIHHIFGGHLQSQVICTKCNMISNRYENMMDLTVEIQGDAESLEECLDQFTMKEWLDGENMYKCDGCNDYVRAWKRLTIHQAPNILTIALKRFQSGRFGKLNKRVTFPEHLDLTPYMSGNGDGTDLYTLYAVVVHLDMLNASFFGHYICYTKDYRGRWYRIDDCKVMNVEVEEVLAQGAYMLLYSRRNARQEPYIKPIEPPMKKPLVVDPEASNIFGETKPVSVDCLPSHDVSLPWHKRNLSIKSSTMDETDLEDMCLDTPGDIKPTRVSNDLGDVEFDNFKPSLLGPKDLEEGKLSISRLLEDISSFKPVRSTSISPTENSSIKVQAIEVKPTIVPEDSGDMDIDYAEPSSLESEDLEEGRPNIAPRVTADTSSVKPTRPHFVSPEEISSVEVQTSEVKPPHIPKDLGDADVDDSEPSLSGPSDLEEAISSTSPREPENISSGWSNSISGKISVEVPKDFVDAEMDDLAERKSRLSPHVQEDVSIFKPFRSDSVSPAGISPIEVQTMGSQEPLVSSDADNCMIEDTGSVSSIEESFKLSKYTPGGYFSSNNTVHNIAETSSRASIASSSTEPEPSYDSRPNLEQVVTACSPSDSANGIERLDSVSSASKGARTPSCRENEFRGDSKPLFSRGFLDRPARKESVVCKDRTQRGNCAVAPAPKVNGRINGYSKPVFTVQNIPDNGVVLESLSSNSNGKDDRLGPRKNFIYPGFLSKSYKQPVNDVKIAKRELGTKSKCNGFAEQACVRQADEEDYRPVIRSSDKRLQPALANGNGVDGAAGSIH